MLRKVLKGEKRDWDTMVPYVLQEEWIQNQETETDVLTYITDIRDRMEETRELVEESAREAQARQKKYYDQKTREMDLKPGDKVLLLLPSSTTKFVAQWQGPYEVTRRVGKVNYEILMLGKGGHKQIFHINHLKKWQERKCNVNAVIKDGDGLLLEAMDEKYNMESNSQVNNRRTLSSFI